jgi:hypothetical protein
MKNQRNTLFNFKIQVLILLIRQTCQLDHGMNPAYVFVYVFGCLALSEALT